MQAERGLQQGLEAAGGSQSGKAPKHFVHVAADFGVGGEQAEVLVEAGGARVVVAGAQVGIALQAVVFAAQHQGKLGVGLVADDAVDDVGTDFFELGGPVDVGLLVETGHQFQHDGHFLAGAGGLDQRFHQHRVGTGAVDGLLDRHHLRVAGRTAQEVHHRVEGFVGVMQQHVAGGDHVEQVLLGQCRRLAGREGRKAQVGSVDQVDDLAVAAEVDRAAHQVAVVVVEIEFLAQALGDGRADVGTHFQPHAAAPGTLAQLVAQRAAQVGHFFLVDEQVAVAGEAERALGLDGEPRKEVFHEALDDRRDQDDAVRDARDFGRHAQGLGQHARCLDDGQARPAAEGITAVQLDGEVQRLAGDAREGVGRVEGDRGEQRLDVAHVDLVGPFADGFGPVAGKEDACAFAGQCGQDLVIEHLVLAPDQLAGGGGDRGDAVAGGDGDGGVAAGQFLEFGHADLEQLVEVAGDDGDVAQALQQRHGGAFGQGQHAAVEGDDALFAVEGGRDGGQGGVVHGRVGSGRARPVAETECLPTV